MKRIHYLLLGLLVSLTIAAVSPSLPPTRIIAGSGVTVVTNSLNSFTLSASGGVGTSNGLATNLSVYTSGGTNRALRVFSTNGESLYVDAAGALTSGSPDYPGVITLNLLNNGGGVTFSAEGSELTLTYNGGKRAFFGTPTGGSASSFQLYEEEHIGWTTSLAGTAASDTAVARTSAGLLQVNNGTAGAFRDIQVRTIYATNFYGRVGGSSAQYKGAGLMAVDTTTTGNVGAGVDTLQYYQVPANGLATNGDSLTFTVAGTFGASVNTKALTVLVGATTVFDTGALAITAAGSWVLKGSVTRTGATTQKCEVTLITSDTALLSFATYSTAGVTLSGAWDFYVKGEGTDDNDLVKEKFRLNYEPAP